MAEERYKKDMELINKLAANAKREYEQRKMVEERQQKQREAEEDKNRSEEERKKIEEDRRKEQERINKENTKERIRSFVNTCNGERFN